MPVAVLLCRVSTRIVFRSFSSPVCASLPRSVGGRPSAERFPRVPARRMYFIPNVLFGSLVLLRAWVPAVCRLVCRFECPPSWVLRKIIASRSRTESDPATLVAHSVSDTSLSNVVAGGEERLI